ncbi:MAG: methyltransferase [Prevotellaceae bacterium]|nr:methyltransferase [Prevotellaceae bacterium]
MSNKYFEFKRFIVWHDECAMKVGTDGVLLGAWANGGKRILDIGTGSGLIALFMAQRYDDAEITAIDIDDGAYRQAVRNVGNTEYADRINVVKASIQDFCKAYGEGNGNGMKFDSIVCNPPFFSRSLASPDAQRSLARHTTAITFSELLKCSASLLEDDGECSFVIPESAKGEFDNEAIFAGLYPSRICLLKTVKTKSVSRCLLAYKKHVVKQIEESCECINGNLNGRSEWYSNLTKDFYIK